MDEQLVKVLGFSKQESRIWKVLQTGSHNISELARLSRFPRTTLYTALSSLKDRGFITEHKRGKAVFISPTSPANLAKILSVCASLMHGDDHIHITSKGVTGIDTGFTILNGKKEMLKVWEKATEKQLGRIYVIQPTRSVVHAVKKFKAGQFVPINNAIKKNKTIMDAVIREDGLPTYLHLHKNQPSVQKAILKSFLGRLSDVTLVRNDFLNMNSELIIMKKSAFLMNWQDEVGVEIENEDMMSLLKELFELAKGYGRKINYNEYIQKFLDTTLHTHLPSARR